MTLRDFFRRFVADTPFENSACEFKCDRTQCRHGEWERCEFRLRGGLPLDLPPRAGGPAAPPGDRSDPS